MRLLLIRHARAESNHFVPDAERPLTDDGRAEFRLVAQDIVDRDDSPTVIFHSPARRTTETANLLAMAVGSTQGLLKSAPWLAMGNGCQEVLSQLAQVSTEVTAIIGHEPIMSSLTAMLMGNERFSFSPGTSACLEFDNAIEVGRGRLLWVLEPR